MCITWNQYDRNDAGGLRQMPQEPATEAESILTGNYEKQHREVRNPVYREAATSFAGGDGSEESPYEISSAEELQVYSVGSAV